ncbi:MAG: M1 family metallopeptidase [Bacteroidales bacterium]|nr:M1 family metallopeptidase [Bacteroidales bacterium]
MKIKYIPVIILIFFTSCHISKKAAKDIKTDNNSETTSVVKPKETNLGTGNKKSELIKNYKGSNTIINDLIHTKLYLKFDYKKKHVAGTAEITLKPYYYPTDSLILDAEKFIIHSVELITDKENKTLKFTYDDSKISIKLNKKYNKDEEYIVKIKYTAKPNEVKKGSSWAIRSNKGLYFIDADTDSPQIWTQGETQSNSAWFPTIDSPNQNMSQEIFLTVNQEYKTLSNGKMISSLPNDDGTRTDHWKQDKPHAPYLTMIAVGKFEIIKDYWRDLPVFVYVEKGDEEKGKALFKKTCKMIEFYSRKLDYDFPWDKYSQIVVRDFVSGAMENTGAVIFGDYVLGFNNEDQRIDFECIVAHELSHHWFGDLVTCESWANLPLNESFATYFEYLWLEHEYGRYAADIHLEQDYSSYSFERFFKDVNLIRFYNKHRDNMFDGHSYQKGGLILHMLRYTVGDEAFWDALELYLKDNEYQAVEIHHLRLAFEEVTGQDLNWFFNQWFLNKGIPEFKITYGYNTSKKTASITIEQIQNLKKFPLYRIPTFIDIYIDNKAIRKEILIDEQKEHFEFKIEKEPLFMNFDPNNSLLCKKSENYTQEEFIEILDKAPLYKDKNQAFENLTNYTSERLNQVYLNLLNHEYWKFRYIAISKMQINKTDALFDKYFAKLKDISEKDKNYRLRDLAKSKLEVLK